jgi:hypothetical protein
MKGTFNAYYNEPDLVLDGTFAVYLRPTAWAPCCVPRHSLCVSVPTFYRFETGSSAALRGTALPVHAPAARPWGGRCELTGARGGCACRVCLRRRPRLLAQLMARDVPRASAAARSAAVGGCGGDASSELWAAPQTVRPVRRSPWAALRWSRARLLSARTH